MNIGSAIRLSITPAAVALAVFALWVAVLAIPGALLLVLIIPMILSITVTVCGLLGVALVLIAVFWRHHRISGVAMLAGFIAVGLLACEPTVPRSVSGQAADLAQVLWYRDALIDQEVRLQNKGVKPAVAVLALDGFGSLTSGIALDRTGEIMLPASKRSKAWVATAGQTELGVDSLEARHVFGDYYSWFHD
jgi:hypothetical protein